jgi:large subunit ribosomal protein L25
MLLKAGLREEIGTKGAKKLRKAGSIPAILYGHGEDAVALTLNLHDLTGALHHGHRLYDVDLNGKSETMLIKDLQYDYLGKEIIHADFVRVDLAEIVTVSVALEFKGVSVGAGKGGMVDVHLSSLDLECQAGNIPESIELSIRELDIDDAIHAGEIELPAGATLKTAVNALVVNCHLVIEAKTTEELEEELPTGPEVITEKAEEPEGE